MNMWGKNKKEDNNIKNFTVGEDRHYDLYLAEFDCEGSIAHAKMLSKTGFLSTEEEKKIKNVLKNLPPEQAKLILSAYYDDKSHRKIAEETDLPLGTVKSRIRLAINRLRTQLEDFEG